MIIRNSIHCCIYEAMGFLVPVVGTASGCVSIGSSTGSEDPACEGGRVVATG